MNAELRALLDGTLSLKEIAETWSKRTGINKTDIGDMLRDLLTSGDIEVTSNWKLKVSNRAKNP